MSRTKKTRFVKLISNGILNTFSDLFRKRSYRKSKRRACSPLGGTCLSGNTASSNPNSPVGPGVDITNTPPVSTLNRYEIWVELKSHQLASLLIHEIILSFFPHFFVLYSPRKYRGSRTSASLKVKGLLGRVWARDSKSKSCENLHVL